MNKSKFSKAVSPLIATILLVAVALSLAAILYSWSSEQAINSTKQVSDKTKAWEECSSINLYIDYGCSYDTSTGISFILNDQSSVEIDDNLTLTVIDANNNIVSSSFTPSFEGRAMLVKSSDFSNATDFEDLVEPLSLVKVYMNNCPDRFAKVNNCS
ncbi:MAG: archaellin/type IV pilin N-terminal domain-containing protein [archaeon]